PATAAMPITGEPLAPKTRPVPPSMPISRLPATRPCCSFAPPLIVVISTSTPYLAKRPSFTPISSGTMAQITLIALPARILSAAYAPVPARTVLSRAAPNARERVDIIIITLEFHGNEFGGEDLVVARLLGEAAHIDERLLHHIDGPWIEMPVGREGADFDVVDASEDRGVEMHHF